MCDSIFADMRCTLHTDHAVHTDLTWYWIWTDDDAQWWNKQQVLITTGGRGKCGE